MFFSSLATLSGLFLLLSTNVSYSGYNASQIGTSTTYGISNQAFTYIVGDRNGNNATTIQFLTGNYNYTVRLSTWCELSNPSYFTHHFTIDAVEETFNLKVLYNLTVRNGPNIAYNFNYVVDYVHNADFVHLTNDMGTYITNNNFTDLSFDLYYTFVPVGSDEMGAETYTQGYEDGYNVGYEDGVNTTDYSFYNLFTAIADTPIFFLRSLFNFDLFGISMITVILSLLTGLLILGVVKHFWK